MRRCFTAVAAFCVPALAAQPSFAQLCSAHTFLGDSPSHGQPGWHTEAQGLAHDRDHWYVTQNTNGDPPMGITLWRIPVTTDLAANVECGIDGVSCSRFSGLDLHPPYNHYGDPDVYEFNGKGYVLVPLEGDGSVPNGLLLFRADETLELLTFTPFPGQVSSAWVAVDGDGILYSSEFNTGGDINRFELDWAAFQSNGEHAPPSLVTLGPVLLQDETGAALELRKAQGGDFSDDGRRFYFLNGDGRADAEPSEGIHVFVVRAAAGGECGPGSDHCIASRIEHSHNSSDPGFAYEFDPGFPTFQEPEGLTYWDLEAEEGAPGTGGQLHAILLDNDDPGADEVWVKHYHFEDMDSDAPELICPHPVTAECESPDGVAAGSPQLGSFFAGASATDTCTAHPQIHHDAPEAFPLGTTPVTFTAMDDSENASACKAPVTVVDTISPTISVRLSHDTLWPPNHKLVAVTADVTIADTCGPPAFELVSIASSEPDDGNGDGHTPDDIQGAEFGTADSSFLLRAERSGSALHGRVYTIVYRVIDGSGNASMATAVVRVPRSMMR